MKQVSERQVKNLSNTDPNTIDNYPHSTPKIKEWRIEEE
jgi:hypothetical protein